MHNLSQNATIPFDCNMKQAQFFRVSQNQLTQFNELHDFFFLILTEIRQALSRVFVIGKLINSESLQTNQCNSIIRQAQLRPIVVHKSFAMLLQEFQKKLSYFPLVFPNFPQSQRSGNVKRFFFISMEFSLVPAKLGIHYQLEHYQNNTKRKLCIGF